MALFLLLAGKEPPNLSAQILCGATPAPPTPHPSYLCCLSSVVFTAPWFLLFLLSLLRERGREMKEEMERTSRGLKTGVCRALGLLPCGIRS